MSRRRHSHLDRFGPTRLEDRTVPAATTTLAFAAGAGGLPLINIVDGATGATVRTIQAFDTGFVGGVRVAAGDFTDDGVADIVAAAGAGGVPHVKLFDGRTGETLSSFFAYDLAFRGGSYVAVGDVTGDGRLEIVTSAGVGGASHVKVFDRFGNLMSSFFAFDPSLRGGCSIAVGDVNGDGHCDIVAGGGMGDGPGIRAFDGGTGALLSNILAYDQAFRGGVGVSAADLDGDGRAEVVAGAGAGGGPHVRVLDGLQGTVRGEFFAYDPGFRGGLCVAACDADGDGRLDIVVGPGAGGGPVCRVFDATTFAETGSDLAFVEDFRGGVFAAGPVRPTFTAANRDAVITWNAVALDAIRADRTSPPRASRALAMVHAAIFDAVNAVLPLRDFYRANPGQHPRADATAAASAAARDVLAGLFPTLTSAFDTALTFCLDGVVDGAAETEGVQVGRQVAAEILALRANDGSTAVTPYTPGTEPGDWQPTPPANAAALLPNWPTVTPFAMTSGSQFRVAAPPALNSAEYAAAYNQVKSLGQNTSTTRTADQTEIALFWADGAGTFTPPGHWNQIAQSASLRQGLSLAENARLFAALNVAGADAAIVSWDAKYAYNYWRPVTAIRAGDTDGNDATAADPNWTPLIVTPPFPTYTSGHSTFSGAASVVLTAFFGDNFAFTDRGDRAQTAVRSFASFAQAADEAGLSRVLGGIHYSFDNQAGLASGRALGRYVADNFF